MRRVFAAVSPAPCDTAESGVVPGLAVVLVGEDPASQVYVRNKARQTVEVGMRSFDTGLRPPRARLRCWRLSAVERRSPVDGIFVQLPLPQQIDRKRSSRPSIPQRTSMVFILSTRAGS